MEDELYEQIIRALDMEIKSQYGSLLNFVKTNGKESFNYENLSRLLGLRAKQRMSLETFMRLMYALGLIENNVAFRTQSHSNITLIDYLSIDNNAVMKMILKVIQL